MRTFLILHNIRSAHNVGAIFRTADAFGVDKIYLTGYSPAPIDRYGREGSGIHKTALGAEKSVHWQKADRPSGLIKNFKAEGFEVVAVEQGKGAEPVESLPFNKGVDVCLIFGNELRGLSSSILSQSNKIVFIEMEGVKESLNVSVAVGIALFALRLKKNS